MERNRIRYGTVKKKPSLAMRLIPGKPTNKEPENKACIMALPRQVNGTILYLAVRNRKTDNTLAFAPKWNTRFES